MLRWGTLGDIQLQPGGTLLAAAAVVGDPRAVDGRAVLLFDVATKDFVAAITVSGVPTALGFSNDGKTLYAGSDGVVDVIDVASRTILGSERDPMLRPGRILASPIGVAVYVLTPSRGLTAVADHAWLSYIDPNTHKLTATRPTLSAQDLAVTHDGSRLLLSGLTGTYALDALTAYPVGHTSYDMGSYVGKRLVGVSADGNRAFVIGGASKSDLFTIDAATGGLSDSVPFESEVQGLLIDPVRNVAYTIANDHLIVINLRWLASGRELASVPVGKWPSWVTVHSESHRAFVANNFEKSITAIDTVTRTAVATIPLTFYPGLIEIDSAGTHLYGTRLVENGAWVLDVATGGVTSLDMEAGGEAMAFNGQKNLLFIALPAAHRVAVVSTVSRSIVGSISLGGDHSPTSLAVISSDNTERLYVASKDSRDVRVFDVTAPFTSGPTLSMGEEVPLQLIRARGFRDEEVVVALTANRGLHVLYEETPDFSPPLVATLPGDARVLVSVSDAYRMYATNTWGPIWKFTHRGRVLMPLAWGTTGTGGIAVQGK